VVENLDRSSEGDHLPRPALSEEALPVTTGEAEHSEGRRLAGLRRAYPSDSTLENLLTVLRAQLDLCARLPLFAYEATTEGHDECATLLERLAGNERAHVEQVLVALQRHLEQRQSAKEATS
jgi:hypothetical protein